MDDTLRPVWPSLQSSRTQAEPFLLGGVRKKGKDIQSKLLGFPF